MSSSSSSETLDRIARSKEAVFAIDSSDRIVLWNRRCEELLGRPARAVLGKRCFDVIAGRDAHGNIYCYRNCPVAFQARE
jgi:PAS domain S-box-containing protein